MTKEFNWDEALTGRLLAAFFMGYIWTQVPGAMLAARFGACHVLLWGVIGWSLLTLVTPACARHGATTLFAVRLVVGLFEGVAMPSLFALLASWTPPDERSRALGFVASGTMLGTVAAFGCSPLVAYSWPAIFYVFGAAGLVWAVAFASLATSYPSEHAAVGRAELELLGARGACNGDAMSDCSDEGIERAAASSRSNGGGGGHGAMLPWRALCREPAFLAICVVHFCGNWGHYLMLSWLPK